ncbi:hypothetical protein F5Y04DRAFT_94357 [Hypomontagnella monticulosa]|nr:hypothetical protein F5Y04DRAFT_94357 [Hypomontagnella monticulosa]
MSTDVVPNWLRIILLTLSLTSFIPQLNRIFSTKDSSGISLYYILFNLISSTEQFTIAFIYLVNLAGNSDVFANPRPTVGDWLNLCQTTLVWTCWLVLFAACLNYPPARSDSRKTFILSIYTAFLCISVIAVWADAVYIASSPGDEVSRRWPTALLHGVHTLLVNPVVTILSIAAPIHQARKIRSSPSLGALSTTGLVIQAIIFAIVAVIWAIRVVFPTMPVITPSVVVTWYQLVGWAAVDNGVFAIGQAALWFITTRKIGPHVENLSVGETEPLL